MKNLSCGISYTLCVLLVVSCVSTGPDPQKQREARVGVERAVAELPKVVGFDPAKVVYFDIYHNELGTESCYLARAYLVIGTQMSIPEALEVYALNLQRLGWELGPFQTPTDKVLLRSNNEIANISRGYAGGEVATPAELAQLETIYRSIVLLRFDYSLHTCY